MTEFEASLLFWVRVVGISLMCIVGQLLAIAIKIGKV